MKVGKYACLVGFSLLLAAPGVIFGQNAPDSPNSAATLEAMRNHFDSDVKAIDAERDQKFAALVKQYLADLNTLLGRYMDSRDLTDAIAVKHEIDRVTDFAPADPSAIKSATILDFSFAQEIAGSQIIDASGSNNNGTIDGAVWLPNGRHGGAYQFGLRDQVIVVPFSSLLNPKQITLAAWIKTSTNDGKWRRIFDKSWQSSYAFSIGGDLRNGNHRCRGKLCLEIGSGSERNHSVLSDMLVADGQWHFVAGTFNGSQLRLYIDGRMNGRPTDWEGSIAGDDHNVIIGGTRYSDATENGLSFGGMIDEPMIFSRGLTPPEIWALYSSQR